MEAYGQYDAFGNKCASVVLLQGQVHGDITGSIHLEVRKDTRAETYRQCGTFRGQVHGDIREYDAVARRSARRHIGLRGDMRAI